MASLREFAGLWVGRWLAPLAALVSAARRGRVFHPEGCTFRAQLEVAGGLSGPWAELAARLSGPGLVRFSAALWRGHFEHLDVLGVALRLRADASVSAERRSSDQDLLFATIRSPFTLLIAAFSTNSHDYLANQYWAVSPFEVGQARHVKFRLLPPPAGSSHRERAGKRHRNDALRQAVGRAAVPFHLEARRTFELSWQRLCTLWLVEPLDIDQEALRFSPFQNGRSILPSGFVHALRRASYAASQRARPSHG